MDSCARERVEPAQSLDITNLNRRHLPVPFVPEPGFRFVSGVGKRRMSARIIFFEGPFKIFPVDRVIVKIRTANVIKDQRQSLGNLLGAVFLLKALRIPGDPLLEHPLQVGNQLLVP